MKTYCLCVSVYLSVHLSGAEPASSTESTDILFKNSMWSYFSTICRAVPGLAVLSSEVLFI